MVARTAKQRKIEVALNPEMVRQTIDKVDQCVARLQKLQSIVVDRKKVTKFHQQTNASQRSSPLSKLSMNPVDWRRISLPAMLVDETLAEILEDGKFAKNIVSAVKRKTNRNLSEAPRTPSTGSRKYNPNLQSFDLRSRRKREKQAPNRNKPGFISPPVRQSRSRINLKFSPPITQYPASRVSPRHKPWEKRTILFPNPLYRSPDLQNLRRSKLRDSPKNRQVPRKLLIRSPDYPRRRSPGRISIPQKAVTPIGLTKQSSKRSFASKLRRSLSPARIANRLVSPLRRRMSGERFDVERLNHRSNSSLFELRRR